MMAVKSDKIFTDALGVLIYVYSLENTTVKIHIFFFPPVEIVYLKVLKIFGDIFIVPQRDDRNLQSALHCYATAFKACS